VTMMSPVTGAAIAREGPADSPFVISNSVRVLNQRWIVQVSVLASAVKGRSIGDVEWSPGLEARNEIRVGERVCPDGDRVDESALNIEEPSLDIRVTTVEEQDAGPVETNELNHVAAAPATEIEVRGMQ
jgi:hypothetical protein